MDITIEKLKINYKGKEVLSRKLTLGSIMNIDCNTAWRIVQESALFEFVCKPIIKFKPLEGKFPHSWKEQETVFTKMLLYGFVPFGGNHSLYFEKIDSSNKVLQTKEQDDALKVWNHTITINIFTSNSIYYKDEIIIYGGLFTCLITLWAKSFYKHRQKRWQLVITSNFQFD